MTFEDIMNYSLDNRVVFDSIVKNYSFIVPFVGAGFSAFAYPTWQEFLENVFEKLEWEEKRDFFKEELNTFRYEEVASFLKKERGLLPFNDDIRQAFGRKLEINTLLSHQAVFLLPILFKGLVLTTNFDRVLENVYTLQNTPFSAIGHPGHNEMLNIALRVQNKTLLYKFHGDIEEVETGLVLTKESYDLYYTTNSPLVKELSKCFKQKILLFLGCSLKEDRTMHILEQVLEHGIEHYAIMPCEKSEIRERTRELGDRRIRTIFYPPNQHNCVRIILERLLETNDKAAYNRLLHYESNINITEGNRFAYNSESVSFFGREKEIEKLKEFCNSGEGVRWWVVTGEGGSGKSRLMYEFQKKYLDPEWETVSPHPCNLDELEKNSQGLKRNILFVIDYVQAHAKDIGKWIEKLASKPVSIKIRIVLIEREGSNIKDASWIEQIKADITSSRRLLEICYDNEFLLLNSLCMKSIKSIMKDYAKKRNKDLSDKDASSLYSNLLEIDSGLTRPLYSMFLVDAWVESKQTFKWSRKDILDYVVTREMDRYKSSIKEVFGMNSNK